MKLVPNNWLYNAGLVGLLRILQAKGVDIEGRLSEGYFELCSEDLNEFADAYCKHVLQASIGRFIPSLDKKDRELLNGFGVNYAEMHTNVLDRLRQEVPLKTSVEQAEQTVKAVVNDFSGDLKHKIERFFKEQQSRLPQTKSANKAEQKEQEKQIKDLTKNLEKAKKVIEDKSLKIKTGNKRQETMVYIEEQKYLSAHLQQFYFNKDTIANPSPPRGRRRWVQFEERFVSPARDILTRQDKEGNSGLVCKFCGSNHVAGKLSTKDKPPADEQRLKDVVFNEGLFSITGVSIEQFANFFYNLIPDLFICDVCELILLCAWTGFNLVPFRLRSGDRDSEYLFVNLPSLTELWKENEGVRKRYEVAQISLKDTIYEDIISELFSRERKERSKWVLHNVLFVEIRTVPSKQRDKPTFKYFHIGKDVAELFICPSANQSLSRITGRLASPSDRKGTYSLQLKREIIKRFLTGDQVYDLAYQVCRQSLDTKVVRPKSVVETVFLHSLRDQIKRKYAVKSGIHPEVVRGRAMEPRQVYGILRGFYNAGASLGQPMDLEKRQRLAYRLMSVVRSGKFAEFYDMLMKLYVDSKRPIPPDLLSLLNPNDAIEFESKAYALLSGFLGEGQYTTTTPETTNVGAAGDVQEIPSEEGEDNG